MTEQDTGRSQRAEAQPPKAALSAEQKKLLQAKHRMDCLNSPPGEIVVPVKMPVTRD